MAEGSRLAAWKNRVALKYADEVTSVSPHQCAELSETGGGRQVHFVPNALDSSEIHRLASQGYDVPVEPGHFVFCGRLAPVKQVPQLIDAFASAIRQGCTRNLFLVGDGWERERVCSRIEELGLSNRVVHLGRMQRRQALRLIRDSYCLVLNSITEAYPLVILEAMALGRPVIAPRIGAIGHLLTDGESGLLFPALDARALTECLLRLDRDPGLAGRLGNRASADYRQLATLDAVLDRYLQLYSG
jgi:glycosyltransferase involved in cell wall biosynthesis